MKTWYKIRVNETDEEHCARTEADAVRWMKHTRNIARIWGGTPTFAVTRHTEEQIVLNDEAFPVDGGGQ